MPKSYKFHCNLTSKSFPFSCDELSSTVLINQGREQNRQLLQGFDGRDVVDSFGICQTWFMSNVLPITRGFSSVYYKRAIQSFPDDLGMDEGQVADQMILIRENYDSAALLVPCFGGVAIYDPQNLAWTKHSVSGYSEGKVTSTFLKGKTYVQFANVGNFSYNFETKEFERNTFTGIVDSAMVGVASSLQYLIFWDSSYMYWGSTTVPTDFIPSLSSGASSSKLLAQKGAITCILPVADGNIIYTTVQAIGATYSGNAIDPWIFREIPNSAGVADYEHVAFGTANDSHIAWTSSGFQAVSLREASQLWPELSDAIAREIYTGFSNQRTYDKGAFPLHGNGDVPISPADETPVDGDEMVLESVYPFHYAIVESDTVVSANSQQWHGYFTHQPELTKVSVPTRIDWKGPMRVKISTIGNRFIAVSIGVESDRRIELADAGTVTTGTEEAPVYTDPDLIESEGDEWSDPTPAQFGISTSITEGALSKKYFDFAYIFDIALNRFGRIDCEHADLFEFSSPQFNQKLTYAECLRREAAVVDKSVDPDPEGIWAYQQFMTTDTRDFFLTEVIAYPDYFDDELGYSDTDISYAALGVERDLATSKFGDNFGILSKDGGVFVLKLFDGKYFQEIQALEGYDAANAIMRQDDDSELGLNTLPHLIHGRYKINRENGVMLHGVNFSKIAAANIASVWAIPHAEDGECLSPIPFDNIGMWQQDEATYQANTVGTDTPVSSANVGLAYHLSMRWAVGEHGKFAGRAAGDSVSVLLAGHFTLTDLVVDVEACGTRNMPNASLDPDRPFWWYFREKIHEVAPATYPPEV